MRASRFAKAVCFGPFILDLRAGELCKDGRKIRLQEQPLQVLRMFIEHTGEVVTREEIKQRLWPNDTVVEFDHSVNAAIKKLRLALGESDGAGALRTRSSGRLGAESSQHLHCL